MPLIGISPSISPMLLKVLSEMGHGDTILLADAHFPSASICNQPGGPILCRADGIKIPELLEGILQLFPLDTYIPNPVNLMEQVESDAKNGTTPPVWAIYGEKIMKTNHPGVQIQFIERFKFYEVAAKAYCIVHTGETAKYGNILLTKGLVDMEQ